MAQIEYIIGDENRLERMPQLPAWRPFDERTVRFCGELSDALIKAKHCRIYPDLVTLAFFLRENNVRKISQRYCDLTSHLGKGLAFHIAPGNVALSFAYSLVTGLLTGNTNIIRLPSRRFEQSDIFCEVLRSVLERETELAQRICLIKYPHDKTITDALSAKCHTRIIWGGDNTVNTIRQSPIPPRAAEITFANRFSLCVIDADHYLSSYHPKKTAHDFYIDTYLTDQNACSSPRIVCWLGRDVETAQKTFWSALYEEIREYDIAPVTTVNKLLTFCKFAAENECSLTMGPDCRLIRVKSRSLSRTILQNIGNGGYFYECTISDIREILPICTWELQTISYIGLDGDVLRKLIFSNTPDGVDRVVPVGRTMEFGFVWDGRDIVREMTRTISTQ